MNKKQIFYSLLLFTAVMVLRCDKENSNLSPVSGKGGSMARFALSDTYLYVAGSESLYVYALGANGSLTPKNTVYIGFGVETIFLYGDNLFLGANEAMYIYNISKPESPAFLSRYDHVVSCDPVVVNGKYAYVSLRVTSECHRPGQDVLEVINISDLTSLNVVQSIPVNSPYGLGVDKNTLFLCQGTNGLSVYDVSKPAQTTFIKQYDGIDAYDVIPDNNTLIVTGKDGIFQYDYTDPLALKLLSQITVE